MTRDVSSLSNVDAITTKHIHLDWNIDFEAQKIRGSATLHLVSLCPNQTEVVLDAKGLTVTAVEVSCESGEGAFEPIIFSTVASESSTLGEGLSFRLQDPFEALWVRVTYATNQDRCLALCWLSPEQTESGTTPFLYSQCQAIHARTILPCQDSPGVRATYTARVQTAHPGAVVLMSALAAPRADDSADGVFHFKQAKAIPSYLIAITAGNIVGKDVSPRCRVYAEPTSVDRAAAEFADVEEFVRIGESIAGPYEWQRYDLIVMPPSFPFGGMENPNLTFVTPTCITGDKSLVELIAHEVCHSWSGNLVGIKSWEHFWINEGFTTYLQRKITERMDGKDVADYEAGTGIAHLAADVERYGCCHHYTALVPPLAGEDPDDAFSSVPYEKGFAFLLKLEALVGAPNFERWIKEQYVPSFRDTAITSADVQRCFSQAFPEQAAQVSWAEEFSTPGMPTPLPTLSTRVRDEANAVADRVIELDSRAGDEDSAFWASTAQKAAVWQGRQHVAFLERLQEKVAPPASLSPATLTAVEATFRYNATVNNEALALWFAVCLRTRGAYTAHMPRLKSFLSTVGRMKFVRPLYRSWASFDLVEARSHFDRCKVRYHAITQKMAQQDFDSIAKAVSP